MGTRQFDLSGILPRALAGNAKESPARQPRVTKTPSLPIPCQSASTRRLERAVDLPGRSTADLPDQVRARRLRAERTGLSTPSALCRRKPMAQVLNQIDDAVT